MEREIKTTLKKELWTDKQDITDKLLFGNLSDLEIKLYTDFLEKVNKYIDICEKRGKRY